MYGYPVYHGDILYERGTPLSIDGKYFGFCDFVPMKETHAPYRKYSIYLRQRYGEPVYRIAVDAGFGCPNRGADRRQGGCIYCDPRGSRAPYQENVAEEGGPLWSYESLRRQVEEGIGFLRKRYNVEKFALYFQAFSSTYAPVDTLRSIYDYCLSLAPFKELIVSTRPDCLSQAIIDLFAGYKEQGYDVWIELGLQSAHHSTLKRIRRGHSVEDFTYSYHALQAAGLKVAVHLIFGLPGEDVGEIMETVTYVGAMIPDGIKIHNLHIPFRTPLYREYMCGEISVPASERHLEYTIEALERLPTHTVIMRLLCDTPTEYLAVPKRFWSKSYFYQRLSEEMKRRNTRQGRLFR
jgi:hypothetical protein